MANFSQKELADYYNSVADDNLRLYNPTEHFSDTVQAPDIAKQQIEKFRKYFFEEEEEQRPIKGHLDKKNTRNARPRDINDEPTSDSLFVNSFNDLDFNLPNTNKEDSSSKIPSTNIDLTDKLCMAFGSNIDAVNKRFEEFAIENGTAEEESQPAKSDIFDEKLKILENISEKFQPGKNDSGMKFDSGCITFDFGLPKLCNESEDRSAGLEDLIVSNKLEKQEDSSDIFEPKLTKEGGVKKLEESAPALPDLDLEADIIPEAPVSLVKTKEEKENLEDWLDDFLDNDN